MAFMPSWTKSPELPPTSELALDGLDASTHHWPILDNPEAPPERLGGPETAKRDFQGPLNPSRPDSTHTDHLPAGPDNGQPASRPRMAPVQEVGRVAASGSGGTTRSRARRGLREDRRNAHRDVHTGLQAIPVKLRRPTLRARRLASRPCLRRELQ